MTKNENLEKFEAVENNVTAFAPKQCSYQKVTEGMENPKMQSLSRCNKRTGRYRPVNNAVSCTALSQRIEILKNRSCRKQWYRLCTKAMFIPKVSWGYGKPKHAIAFMVQKNALGVTARQITRFHEPRIWPRMEIWENSKLSKTVVPPLHQSNVYTKS